MNSLLKVKALELELMKPQLVINPSTAGNVSTQSNWLFTFTVKLLKGRLDQFVPQVRFLSAEWSFLHRGLETCLLNQTRFSSTQYYVSNIRLKVFRAACKRLYKVSMPPSVPWLHSHRNRSAVSRKNIPAQALMVGTQEKLHDSARLAESSH